MTDIAQLVASPDEWARLEPNPASASLCTYERTDTALLVTLSLFPHTTGYAPLLCATGIGGVRAADDTLERHLWPLLLPSVSVGPEVASGRMRAWVLLRGVRWA